MQLNDAGTRHLATRCERRWRNILCLGLLVSTLTGCGVASDPESLLQRAREAQSRGELRAAWIETRNLLLAEPDHAEARLLMGELQLAVGAAAEAEKELRRARELGIPAARSELLLVRSVQMQGRNDDVIDLTEEDELPEVEPADHANLLGLRAQAQYALGQFEAAGQTATAALAIDAQASEAVLTQAMLMTRNNEVEAAAAALDANLEQNPAFASGWHLRGDLHRVRGEIEGAVAAYAKAIEHRSYGLVDRVKHATALIALGDEKSLDAALLDAKELSRRAPKYSGADYIRGLVSQRRGNPTAARDAFLAALAKAPDYTPAKLYLAQTHLALGERQQAENLLSAVVNEMPWNRDARRLLGTIRLRRGDFAGVAEVLTTLVNSEDTDAATLKLLGTAYFGLDRGQEAVALFERAAALNPESASTQAQLGLALLAGGASERGVAALEAAIDAVPEDPRTRSQLVTAMMRAGDLDRALDTAKHFLEATPDSPVSLKLLAMVHTARGEQEAADEAFKRVLATDPADPSSNHALARSAIDRGELAEARARYEAVLAALPEHERTLIALTELDSREGRLDEARRRLEGMIARDPSRLQPRLMLAQYHLGTKNPLAAQRLLAEVREAGLEDSSWLLLMASASTDARQPAEAAGYLERLVKRNPASVDFTYRLAQAYAASGKHELATESIERALKLAPDHLPSLVARFRGLELSGRHEEARSLLEDLQKRFPADPEVKAQAGWLAARSQDAGSAVENLETAYASQPTAALALDIAAAKSQSGDEEGAIATLRDWLEKQPKDAGTRTILGLTLMGLGRSDEGLEALREVVRLTPGDPLALNNLAWFLIETNPAEALQLAEKAYAGARDNTGVIDTLARARSANLDHRGAERLLRDSLNVNPERIELRLSLVNSLEAAGNLPAARSELQAILKAAPDNATAKALQERIGR
jgi:cellulose synthase operon protein C